MKSIFNYTDYKVYLKEWIATPPRRPHGERTRLAQSLGCQSAYMSQVLGGNAHLSLEQAERCTQYIGLPPLEADYFIQLVSENRAGSVSLKKYFQKKLKAISQKQSQLKDKLKFTQKLSFENQALYYSSWHFIIVHMILSLPEYEKDPLQKISKDLGISRTLVAEAITALLEMGLIKKENNSFKTGPTSLFLGTDSPFLKKHHLNWRVQAIRSLDLPKEADLHYSSVITCARSDLEKIRATLVDAIERVRTIVKDSSPNEKTVCYCLDFFDPRKT